jgi:hypothetical protein
MTPQLTTDPRPSCGHEDCQAWLTVDLGYVTRCEWDAAFPLEVTA